MVEDESLASGVRSDENSVKSLKRRPEKHTGASNSNIRTKIKCHTCGCKNRYHIEVIEHGNEIRVVCRCGSYHKIGCSLGIVAFSGEWNQ